MKYPTQSARPFDLIAQGHGSIILLRPQNPVTKAWLYDNCDVQQEWGEGVAVEPRYVSPIIEGLMHYWNPFPVKEYWCPGPESNRHDLAIERF